MQVFQSIDDARGLKGCAVALGNFDGVHLGHQALFAEARRRGKPVALTFWPHPGKVLQPELAPKLIYPLERKLEELAAIGVEATILQPFTMEYARSTSAAFEESLWTKLGAAHAVVGSDFTYGSKRSGTLATLKASAAAAGTAVHEVAPVTVEGVVASSTKVREYLLEGRVGAAQMLLGRYFDLDGQVVRGQGRGRGMGFPTANVDTQSEVRPAAGVYAVRAAVRDASGVQGPWRAGAANIGVKPTFGGSEVTIEVHLLDVSEDLYGQSLRVQFVERIRAEQRFASIEELKNQIRRDVESARAAVARAAPSST